MEYMLLIYTDEQAWARLSGEERSGIVSDYVAVSDAMRESGVWRAGAPLQATPAASSVRLRDGEPLVTAGPFAETREQLGGYFLIEADTDDEAVAWAARLPAARYGTVEVRPLLPVETGDLAS
jgi:hypothetical protein